MHKVFVRLALLAVAALFVRVASADMQVLYFMLDNPLTVEGGGSLEYSFAMVAFSQDGTNPDPTGDYLTLYGSGGTDLGTAVSSDSTAPLYVGLGDSNSPTGNILFEMWLESPEGSFQRVAYHSADLANLSQYIVSMDDMMLGRVPAAGPYGVAVPEPTSGLLVLLGAAVLALRRKRF